MFPRDGILMDTLIGRKKEKEELLNLYLSERSEFVTVYGRRRVGKTFLVNNLFFNDYYDIVQSFVTAEDLLKD